MKVSIIGGGGLVGSCTAFALQTGKVVREIALVDANAEMAEGQALDVLHGASLMADQTITAGGYEHIPTSDLICITAGLRRKPDESRLDLINRNVDLFLNILGQVVKAGHKPNATVLVVSNPVDVLTYLAASRLDLPPARVIGLGTQLDTVRFRSLIAQQLDVGATQVKALILGEHGDSMVPIWSSATVAGLPLEKFPGWTPHLASELFTRTKGSGAEVIKKKGAPDLPWGWRFKKSSRPSHWTAAQSCRFRRCKAAATESAMWRSACRPSSAPRASWARTNSSSGPRKCKPCARAARCCGKRSIPCCNDCPPTSKTFRPEPWKNRSIASWLPSTPIPQARRTSSWPMPRTPTWHLASVLRAARPRCTPAKFACAPWPSTAKTSARSRGRDWSTSCSCRPAAATRWRLAKGCLPTATSRRPREPTIPATSSWCATDSMPASRHAPFARRSLDHIQCGHVDCAADERGRGANLGLYSVTFNNRLDEDLASLERYRQFREEAERKGFRHFLEVFDPNAPQGLSPETTPQFVNDCIARTLAGVAAAGRPIFLKIVYHGPRAMEELVAYDPRLVVGILGGGAGTTYDAFKLIAEAQKYGARAALFGARSTMPNASSRSSNFCGASWTDK